jgi:hypothetical protein
VVQRRVTATVDPVQDGPGVYTVDATCNTGERLLSGANYTNDTTGTDFLGINYVGPTENPDTASVTYRVNQAAFDAANGAGVTIVAVALCAEAQ